MSHRLFEIAVFFKGADGILETIGAVLLAIFGADGVNRIVALITQHELSQDPHDRVASWVVRHTRTLHVGSVDFAVAYLLLHGVFKILIAIGLFKEIRWVFPVALVVFGGFVLYEWYRMASHPSATIAVLSSIDVLVCILVWREYRSLPAS